MAALFFGQFLPSSYAMVVGFFCYGGWWLGGKVLILWVVVYGGMIFLISFGFCGGGW